MSDDANPSARKVPLLVAAVLLAMFGVETRRRRLEEIETESALAARALTPGYTGR